MKTTLNSQNKILFIIWRMKLLYGTKKLHRPDYQSLKNLLDLVTVSHFGHYFRAFYCFMVY